MSYFWLTLASMAGTAYLLTLVDYILYHTGFLPDKHPDGVGGWVIFMFFCGTTAVAAWRESKQ